MTYEGYQRLRFDRPHPRVLRVTMDNGRMNTADAAMHAELVRIWRTLVHGSPCHTALGRLV